MKKQNLFLLHSEKKTLTTKRLLILLGIVFLTVALITPHLVVHAGPASAIWEKISNFIMDALKKLFFPDPPDCYCGVPGLGKHHKGEFLACKNAFYEWGTMKKNIYNWSVNWSTFDQSAKDFTLSGNNSLFNQVWGILASGYEGMVTIGYLLLMLYFVLELLDLTTKESFSLEQLLKMTIKLFIGILLIANGFDILFRLVEFSDGLIMSTIGGVDSESTSIAKALIYSELEPLPWYEAIFYPFQRLGDVVRGGLLTVIYKFMIYGRVIEIAVRALFAPVAMANIYQGGLNSSGMRYLKKFLAICLQGAIMYACVIVTVTIQSNIGDLEGLILALVSISVMIKSKSWANDVVGV